MKKLINKLKYIISLVKYLLKSDSFVLYYVKDNDVNVEEKNISNIPDNIYADIINNMKTLLINNKFNGDIQQYSARLNEFDIDLYNAYQELNYLDVKTKCIEQEFQYYKDMNTPGLMIDGNAAYMRYNRICELKKQLNEIEKQLT